MPNWVFNCLSIQAIKADPKQIDELISQLNTPFVRNSENWDLETNQMLFKDYTYTNPIFAFWNITKPTDMETYKLQKDPSVEEMSFAGNNWYDWKVRNWGTKWDVAVENDNKDPDTTMERHDKVSAVIYNFNTAGSPPTPAILALSSQYPELVFHLHYQEETGWGGDIKIMKGVVLSEQSYDNQCDDCGSINCIEYCDNDCGYICSSCNWLGEADLDCVAGCDIHKVYLDSDHVEEYRL